MKALHPILCTMALGVVGCAHRTADMYRDDTAKLFATKDGDIKSCYDGVLQKTPTATGKVTIKFAVEKDTGKIVDAAIDSSSTTAPDEVARCVLTNLANLALSPADKRRGEATWSWDFTAAAAPAAAPKT